MKMSVGQRGNDTDKGNWSEVEKLTDQVEPELHLNIQPVNAVSVMKTSQLMLYREIIAVCSEIHTKHINTVCGHSALKLTPTSELSFLPLIALGQWFELRNCGTPESRGYCEDPANVHNFAASLGSPAIAGFLLLCCRDEQNANSFAADLTL